MRLVGKEQMAADESQETTLSSELFTPVSAKKNTRGARPWPTIYWKKGLLAGTLTHTVYYRLLPRNRQPFFVRRLSPLSIFCSLAVIIARKPLDDRLLLSVCPSRRGALNPLVSKSPIGRTSCRRLHCHRHSCCTSSTLVLYLRPFLFSSIRDVVHNSSSRFLFLRAQSPPITVGNFDQTTATQ